MLRDNFHLLADFFHDASARARRRKRSFAKAFAEWLFPEIVGNAEFENPECAAQHRFVSVSSVTLRFAKVMNGMVLIRGVAVRWLA